MKRQSGSLSGVALISLVVGAGVVAGALLWRPAAVQDPASEPSVEYGRRLLRETAALLGPGHEDPAMQYTGTYMDCASCHLDTGTRPGTLSLLQSATQYPRFSGRDGGERDLRDRINGCMTRSMNGRELSRDSLEMLSMEMYIRQLNEQFGVMGESRRQSGEPATFAEPDRAADVAAGELVYQERCQVCHGEDGEGLAASTDMAEGYLFPPLWGPDSFNNGAGMTRLLTAARFIKARMPLGQPDLTDDEAYDVAAFVNSHERPQRANLEQDYPDLTNKPVDSPYPPYADTFPIEQHRLGPFEPIREFYRDLAVSGDR
ncbi:MAG: c-type cytochrome [Gammaproteobacteria bacterium]|nr:c-type cytochrome [Pseudomonadales bacterium]MCP5347051.1 c-type cytochrome [Pseudomonadales bacterium]